jgi:hypothetical protein
MDISAPEDHLQDLAPRPSRPHLPVRGVWDRVALWFSSADPEHNTWFALRPVWAFALDEHDFSGSPTRWSFAETAGQ